MTRPWGVNSLNSMIGSPDIKSSGNGIGWTRAVPMPYAKNFRETIRAAWWVFTGKAEAVVWPTGGEIDAHLLETRTQERNNCAAIVSRHLDMVGGFQGGENEHADLVSRGYANACVNILMEIHGPRFILKAKTQSDP